MFAFGQDFGLFWVMTSGNVSVFSAYWFNTGYMSTSVYGGFWNNFSHFSMSRWTSDPEVNAVRPHISACSAMLGSTVDTCLASVYEAFWLPHCRKLWSLRSCSFSWSSSSWCTGRFPWSCCSADHRYSPVAVLERGDRCSCCAKSFTCPCVQRQVPWFVLLINKVVYTVSSCRGGSPWSCLFR